MVIKSWPEQERPREKMLKQGANALSDAELLALIYAQVLMAKMLLVLHVICCCILVVYVIY